MKKIIFLSIFLSLSSAGYSYAIGTVTIIKPAFIKKPPPIAFALKRRISLVGNVGLTSALALLARSTNIPFVIKHASFITKTKEDYYLIHKPLYVILNSLINANGYVYKYKNGEIIVYGEIEKTFKLPISNLNYTFSAATGENNNSNMAQPNQSQTAGIPPSTSLPAPTANAAAQSSAGINSSNPGGQIESAMSLNTTAVIFIKRMLKPLISKKGVFGINSMLGIIYIKDKPSRVSEAARWIKKIRDNMAEAVWLKVQIIDVSLNNSYQEGINWNQVLNSAFKSNVLGMTQITIGANLADGAGIQSGAPSIEFADETGTNTAVLQALSSQGSVNVLSTPTLMVLNGQTGIISNNSISNYIQTVENISTGLTSSQTYPVIAQVQAGISAAFTPHINKKNGVITVVINFLDNNITGYNDFSVGGNTFDDPVIQSKTLSDIIRVKNNNTVVIGGILSADKNNQHYGVPILSDIPVLGYLFKGVNNNYTKDDLIMMITPKIIKF